MCKISPHTVSGIGREKLTFVSYKQAFTNFVSLFSSFAENLHSSSLHTVEVVNNL